MLHKRTFWIQFIGDRSIQIKEGQTILEASLLADIPHYHACGGNGECSTCRVRIHEGGRYLSDLSEKEKQLRQAIPLGPNVRLACQTYVKGTPVSLHRMIRDEADLNMYLDEDVREDLQSTGHVQELALFFLDIRNFTPFIESYLPFDVIHIVRRLFSLFRKCIETHQGQIIETSGDGFYAVFGFETDISKAACQAFDAGQSILKELEEFNQQYAEKYFFHQFEAGIGLHAGKVIVGNIGIGVNNNLTVMGLPVNVASRIQGATRKLNNSFLISDVFYELLSSKPASEKVEATLKGIKETYQLHLCGKPYTNSV